MIIYCTENLLNGKCYVGQTTLGNKDYLGSGLLMIKAIEKYGKENFKRITIEKCLSQEELDKKEAFWIKELNTLVPNGYNLMSGSNGNGGHSEGTKQQISESHKGIKPSEETKQKMKENHKGFTGQKHTEETLEKMREAKLGKLVSEETRQKLREAGLGKTWEEIYGEERAKEMKKKKSESQIGIPLSEKARQKIRESRQGKHHTEETLEKMREASLGENNPMFGKRGKDNPNYGKHHTEKARQKIREAKLGRPRSEETKEKIRSAMKKVWERRKKGLS